MAAGRDDGDTRRNRVMTVSWVDATTMVVLLMEVVMLICITHPVYSNRTRSPVFIETNRVISIHTGSITKTDLLCNMDRIVGRFSGLSNRPADLSRV